MRSWFAVEVTAAPAAGEAVEHAFNILDCLGTEISDLRRKDDDAVRVVGYFDQLPDDAEVEAALAQALEVYGLSRETIISIAVRKVPETDWLAEWKRHWTPTGIGPFVVAPPWAGLRDHGKIVIRIEPNMAFGTGTHETTQLCLDAIGKHFRDRMSFLDVGTGTGILAIAAAKLSPASRIVACDIDADAVKIARANAEANAVAERIEFLEGSIGPNTPAADFVCANLTLDVITPLLPLLLKKANKILLLSGILAEQEGRIRSAISGSRISNFKLEHAGEWLSVLIRK